MRAGNIEKFHFFFSQPYSLSPRLSALGRKLRFQLFFPIKVDPLNSASQSQAKNIPMVLPSSPKNYILSEQRKNVMMLYRNYSEVM